MTHPRRLDSSAANHTNLAACGCGLCEEKRAFAGFVLRDIQPMTASQFRAHVARYDDEFIVRISDARRSAIHAMRSLAFTLDEPRFARFMRGFRELAESIRVDRGARQRRG